MSASPPRAGAGTAHLALRSLEHRGNLEQAGWLAYCSAHSVAGVRKFPDLIAWQLSVELCDLVFEITAAGASARDVEFRAQIRNAAKKAPALIAEGFLRFTPGEFIRYLRMARGELGEIQNHLEFARRRSYFTSAQLDQAHTLSIRAMTATSRLLKSKLPKTTPPG